jgi:hypothetical protein
MATFYAALLIKRSVAKSPIQNATASVGVMGSTIDAGRLDLILNPFRSPLRRVCRIYPRHHLYVLSIFHAAAMGSSPKIRVYCDSGL